MISYPPWSLPQRSGCGTRAGRSAARPLDHSYISDAHFSLRSTMNNNFLDWGLPSPIRVPQLLRRTTSGDARGTGQVVHAATLASSQLSGPFDDEDDTSPLLESLYASHLSSHDLPSNHR